MAGRATFFKIQRGVRQVCPLSPCLFVLSAEVLAKTIRKDSTINGNLVNNKEIKLSQHGDDKPLILNGLRQLINCLQILDDFYKVSGLKLNAKQQQQKNNRSFLDRIKMWEL